MSIKQLANSSQFPIWFFLIFTLLTNAIPSATATFLMCVPIGSLSISSSTWSLNSSYAITDLSLVECREPSGLNKEGGVTENSYLPRRNCRSISGLVLDAIRSVFINFLSSLMAVICWLTVTIASLLLETNVPIFFFMLSHIDLSPKNNVSVLNKKFYTERGSIFARIDFHEFHAFREVLLFDKDLAFVKINSLIKVTALFRIWSEVVIRTELCTAKANLQVFLYK